VWACVGICLVTIGEVEIYGRLLVGKGFNAWRLAIFSYEKFPGMISFQDLPGNFGKSMSQRLWGLPFPAADPWLGMPVISWNQPSLLMRVQIHSESTVLCFKVWRFPGFHRFPKSLGPQIQVIGLLDHVETRGIPLRPRPRMWWHHATRWTRQVGCWKSHEVNMGEWYVGHGWTWI